MSHWIKVHNNNLDSLSLISFLIPFISHSYGSLVLSQSCVMPSYLKGIFYHSLALTYINREAQKLGKFSMAHSQDKVRGNVFV